MRTYGIDLLPYAFGNEYMSVRKFLNMLQSLPDDSAWIRAISSNDWKNRIKK